jgi:3-oxoadipate enol-lactonase
MLISLPTGRIYYDIVGPHHGEVVCFTHSLSSDGGMWAEQVPPLLAAGYRVLRLDMRGHGGSDPVAGDYTMEQLADDVAAALDFLGIARIKFIGLSIGGMLGQAFAIKYGNRLVSAMLCDTSPQTPQGAREMWAPRIEAVTKAKSVAPLAEGTMERWFTDAFRSRNPGRWKEIHATIGGTTAAGFLGCAAAILNFDFVPKLPSVRAPILVVCGADDPGTPPAGNKRIADLVARGRYQEIVGARHFPNVEQHEVFNHIMMDWVKDPR